MTRVLSFSQTPYLYFLLLLLRSKDYFKRYSLKFKSGSVRRPLQLYLHCAFEHHIPTVLKETNFNLVYGHYSLVFSHLQTSHKEVCNNYFHIKKIVYLACKTYHYRQTSHAGL